MTALRDRIAAIIKEPFENHLGITGTVEQNRADAILALVAEHLASDAAVEAAKMAQYRVSGHMGGDASMKAALAAAIGGRT